MKCPGCGLDLGDDLRQAAPPPAQQADSDKDVVRRLRREEVLTTAEVCRIRRISDETLAKRIQLGKIPAPQETRPRRWHAAQFFAWHDRHPIPTRRSYFTKGRAARVALLVGER